MTLHSYRSVAAVIDFLETLCRTSGIWPGRRPAEVGRRSKKVVRDKADDGRRWMWRHLVSADELMTAQLAGLMD